MSEKLDGLTLNILGIPYRIEVADLPDPYDVDCVRFIDRSGGIIRLQSGSKETFAKRSLFGAVAVEAAQSLAPETSVDWGQVETFARTYYGVLRKNQPVLAFCCGWSDDLPDFVDVAGVRWAIEQVKHCPGNDKDTFGLTVYRQQTIYLQQEVNLSLKRLVLLHELGHAVAEFSAVGLIGDEAFLRAYHNTLGAVLRDNPRELLAYLFDCAAEGV